MTDAALVTDLKRTPLYDLHVSLGAKMVPFAGYLMPVQYPAGILTEHRQTRTAAGLFDVSHMGQARLDGKDAAQAIETLVPADIMGLGANRQRYALFTNETGGILDDLMVCNAGDHLKLVVNAACKEADFAHLEKHIGNRVKFTRIDDHALLALQGPSAEKVLSSLDSQASSMIFMEGRPLRLDGIPCFVTRSGYTGEDGYEISVPVAAAEKLARRLLDNPEVRPIGLGARDSLRLEAGLCLYGHDMNDSTTPVEASLLWAISNNRRAEGSRAGGFPGADIIFAQQQNGVARKRVGLLPQERTPVREGAEIVDAEGTVIGNVCSGGFGPTLGAPLAMGYLDTAFTALDSEVWAIVRGKPVPLKVSKLPFVPQRYYRG